MVLINFTTRRLLTACVCSLIFAGTLLAQPKAQAPSTPLPAYPSAFDGYKPFTDEPIGNWKAANENVARIGGWREYARQAQQPDNTPAAQPAHTVPKPTTQAKP